jgi:hypothetical protein
MNDEGARPMDSAPIPKFLAATLETMGFRRHAGEWDFELTGEARQAPSQRVLAVFFECFPWASVYESPTNAIPGPSSSMPEDDAGFETSLTLRLFWLGADGQLGESELPDAGKLIYDRVDGMVFLTIWPNLFTDTVPIYERHSADVFGHRDVPWAPAAQRNRQQLASSLACWATSMPGEVLSAESDLVDGVHNDGFSDAATSA